MATFAELGVGEEICRGLDALGLVTPTPIQKQVIPCMLNNPIDLIGLAQTGTGKTAAFAIPLIQQVETRTRQTQVLVLCPTRELCVQVARDMTALAGFINGMRILAVYGGAGIDQQIRAAGQGAQIIVATPGRLHDLIRRRKVDVSQVRFVVLDEADEMLQMGFQEELDAILSETPPDRKTMLFSATMPDAATALAGKYMRDPLEITVGSRNSGAENIHHIYYVVQVKDRYPALRRLIDIDPAMYAIVFCRTRQDSRQLAEKLMQDGYSADALHGDLSQSQRDQVMEGFRSRRLCLLVATDVAARGLDVSDLTHVINYNLPDDIASYTHRSGRTGRAGRAGTSVSMISARDLARIRELEKKVGRKFEKGIIPSGKEVCQTQLLSRVENLMKSDAEQSLLEPFMAAITESLAGVDREELIRRFFAADCGRLLQHYRNAPDMNVNVTGRDREYPQARKSGTADYRGSRPELASFQLNIGKRDGIHAKRLIGEINEALPAFPRVRIGRIEVADRTTLLEADSKFAVQIVDVFEQLQVNGKRVSVQVDFGPGNRQGRSDRGDERGSARFPGRTARKINGFAGALKNRRKPAKKAAGPPALAGNAAIRSILCG